MSNEPSSESYIHGHHEAVLRSHRSRTAENSAAYMLDRLAPDARVLDVGCGPGSITVGLAQRVPQGHVTGIDSSPCVLEQALSAPGAAEQANLSFEDGDVYSLRFQDDSFDVVHAHQVLQHLTDPVAALVEMRRVCRPGGVVAARDADFGVMCWHPESPEMTEWCSLYRQVARGAGGEPDAGRRLGSWARSASFSRVDVSASAWSFSQPAETRWWGELWAERMTDSRFADHAIGQHLATPAELGRLSDAWRAWAADADACFFVLHGEIICTP